MKGCTCSNRITHLPVLNYITSNIPRFFDLGKPFLSRSFNNWGVQRDKALLLRKDQGFGGVPQHWVIQGVDRDYMLIFIFSLISALTNLTAFLFR